MTGAGVRFYSPRMAWLLAPAYFAFCLIAAAASGVLGRALREPLAEPEHWQSPLWIALTAACWAVILVAYGLIWPRGTFTDGRKSHPLLATLYGLAWGLCQGLWFLTLWSLVARSGLPVLWVALISYLLIGGYNSVYHRYFWDIHVSPPHNYREWNAKKVLFCHTPNLLVCLTHYALFQSDAMFALLQGAALALSARAMRFPAPWDDYHAVAGQERSLEETLAATTPK